MFLMIILGTTDKRALPGFAPIGIPVTNLSVNPARSTASAIFVGGWALQQLWLFRVAPIIFAAAVAGVVYTVLETKPEPMMREALAKSSGR
jgi:aquaporin Z